MLSGTRSATGVRIILPVVDESLSLWMNDLGHETTESQAFFRNLTWLYSG